MKIRASAIFKHIGSILTSLTKSKTSIKKKAGEAKTHLLLFSLMRNNRTLFTSIKSKFHGLLEKDSDYDDDEESRMKAVMVHAVVDQVDLDAVEDNGDDDDDEHCDRVTSSLLEIDHVKVSGEEVELEDEIDRVADVFIRRFHRQMKLQKMESFKRLREMLQRSL